MKPIAQPAATKSINTHVEKPFGVHHREPGYDHRERGYA
jgi:hypothetical protein